VNRLSYVVCKITFNLGGLLIHNYFSVRFPLFMLIARGQEEERDREIFVWPDYLKEKYLICYWKYTKLKN